MSVEGIYKNANKNKDSITTEICSIFNIYALQLLTYIFQLSSAKQNVKHVNFDIIDG